MSKNRAASIRARLKKRADATKQDFNLTLTHYGLERLLYRLSVSRHAPNFLLKGALLFLVWGINDHRPTRDAGTRRVQSRCDPDMCHQTRIEMTDLFA